MQLSLLKVVMTPGRALLTAFLQGAALVLTSPVLGAPPAADYVVQVWQNGDGLPQSSVTSMAQTPDGYLWLGTFNGLARFDGVRFVVFDDAVSPALPSNRIVKVLADSQGRLWILSEEGVLTVYAKGRFSLARTLWPGLPELCSSIAESGGTAYVEGRDGWFYGITGGQAKRAAPVDSSKFGGCYASALDGQGKLWVSQWKGLRRLEGDAFVTVANRASGSGFPREMLRTARDGSVWAAGLDEGLRRYRDGKIVGPAAPLPRPSTGLQDVWEDTAGQVWVATVNAGLFCYGTNGQWRVLTIADGLSINSLRCVYQDSEDNIWVGTDGGGLDKLCRRRIEMWDERRGLSGKVVLSVCAEPDGGMWLGFSGNGLDRLQNGKVEPANLNELVTHNASVWCMIPDGHQGVCLSTRNDGSLIFADASQARKVDNPRARVRQYAISLFRDHAGGIWMGDITGLTRFQDGQFTGYTSADGFPATAVRAIAENQRGEVWFGTDQGLWIWDGRRLAPFDKAGDLPDQRIWSLCMDQQDTLWVGTSRAGLARVKNHQVSSLRPALPVRQIGGLMADDMGGLWAGTPQGIYRLNLREINDLADGRLEAVSFRHFGSAEGINNPECAGGHQPSVCKAPDGKVWFATVSGAAVVDPANLGSAPPAPRMLIEEVKVDGEAKFALATENRSISIPPGRHHLEIRYTGLGFTSPKEIRFRYRLRSLGDEKRGWSEETDQRVVQFEALPPGSYEFKVAARNGGGLWGPAAVTLGLVVQPELWQRGWFRWLLVGLLACLVAALYQWQAHQFAQRQEQAAVFAAKLIESQERERKRIASELHDGLGQELLIIKNRATLALSDAGDSHPAPEALREISEVASQALAACREMSHNLRPYQLDHLGLSKALQGICRKVGQASSLQLSCNVAPLDGLFKPEQEINIYRIVQEALNNMVKHSNANAGSVLMFREEGKVILVIEDNGKGMDGDVDARLGGSDNGLGFTSISERVKLLGGRLEVNSRPGCGTKLNIELPT